MSSTSVKCGFDTSNLPRPTPLESCKHEHHGHHWRHTKCGIIHAKTLYLEIQHDGKDQEGGKQGNVCCRCEAHRLEQSSNDGVHSKEGHHKQGKQSNLHQHTHKQMNTRTRTSKKSSTRNGSERHTPRTTPWHASAAETRTRHTHGHRRACTSQAPNPTHLDVCHHQSC